MKKILNISLVVALFALWSCEDVTDSFEGLDDAKYSNHYGKELLEEPYTLMEEDYALSSNENIQKYKNFSPTLESKDYLPEILDAKFFAEEVNTEIKITFDYYSYPEMDMDNAYEIKDVEYAQMGQDYPNFDNEDKAKQYIPAFMSNAVYFSSYPVGTQVTVKYTLTSSFDIRFIKVNDDFSTEVLEEEPDVYYLLTGDDYDLLGEKYGNFYSIGDAESQIASFAQMEEGNGAGYYACQVYRSYYDKYLVCSFGGEKWSLLGAVNPKTETYKYDGDNWLFVAPIKFVKSDKAFTDEYTLTDADYELVGNGRYNNFDVREGKPEESEEVRIAKITKILKNNFELELGQVYKVSYEVYSGTNETWDITLEAVEDK